MEYFFNFLKFTNYFKFILNLKNRVLTCLWELFKRFVHKNCHEKNRTT